MATDTVFTEFAQGFVKKKFSAALLMSFIDLFLELDVPAHGFQNFDELLKVFPAVQAGAAVLTLNRPGSEGTISIRGFYDAVETCIRAENGRLDYPSCAPYATGRWHTLRAWLDALSAYTEDELLELRSRVLAHVLDLLPDQRDAKTIVREPPLFMHVLQSFDLHPRQGEPKGAAWQGIVFGFLRADNPHLQVEIRKVHTGSKRLNRIGDIDAWDGIALALSAEAKHYDIDEGDLTQFTAFQEAVRRKSAIGLIAALSFTDAAREAIESQGIRALSAEDMIFIVSLWDPAKQRVAVSSLLYYLQHVESKSRLTERMKTFLDQFENLPIPTSEIEPELLAETRGESNEESMHFSEDLFIHEPAPKYDPAKKN